MPRAYSVDLRQRVLAAARDDQLSHGEVAPKPHAGGARSAVDAAGAAVLESLVEERDERTLAELADAYRERTGARLSVDAVGRACRRLDLRRTKRSLAATEQAREDVAQAREAWAAAAPALRPENLVFVDESGIATNMARTYGRAKGGRRARGAVPAGHWQRLTLVGGLSLAGLIACMTVDAAADTDVLVAFTRHVLVPALRPGQVVVLDNLSAHKAPAVRQLIEGAGCRLLFLPPYSPDLNPIEAAWSKLKTLLRGLGARTVDALNAALTTLVEAITADDADGYFRHCGYAAPRETQPYSALVVVGYAQPVEAHVGVDHRVQAVLADDARAPACA